MLTTLGFASPWLLIGLLALPVLWLILRAIPPAPIRRRFPGVALLLGLKDETSEADRTPWWLLLLRMLAIGAAIIGFSGPILNPEPKADGSGPLLVVADGTWADARDWERRKERIAASVNEARRGGRMVAIVSLTDPPTGGPVFQAADQALAQLPALTPRSWEPDPKAVTALAAGLPSGAFQTLWLSDGLARDSRAVLLKALMARGTVRVVEMPSPVMGLRPAVIADGLIKATVLRSRSTDASDAEVAAFGLDPAGIERELARANVTFKPGESAAVAQFDLPPELRNRIARFEIAGLGHAGAVSLTDDALKRRKVALIDGSSAREGLELLSPTHYLRKALAPVADLIDGTIGDVLQANPDVIILADVAKVAESDQLLEWVGKGGLLVRFAGPKLAASDIGRQGEDPLLPVRLRAGGRTLGGAMSWGAPKTLAPFAEGSPFAGLVVPPDVKVSSQVMAEPDPDLANRTVASLDDGTPLVTERAQGDGRIVLFHVTANAEWSTLPLSGLFVQMLERLAVSTGGKADQGEMQGTTWVADKVLDAWGKLDDAGNVSGVPGERLAAGITAADLPPGLYGTDDRRFALNVVARDRTLSGPVWPAGVSVEGLGVARSTPLGQWFLSAALVALMLDVIAALWLGGRLGRLRGAVATILLALGLLLGAPHPGQAQQAPAPTGEDRLIEAAGNVVLAYVLTGDARVDQVSQAGMRGLSEVLFARTTVEPGTPMGVNLETDELSVFSLIYWPVTANEVAPTPAAYARLNRYLRSGGMILFDTRDAGMPGAGNSPEAQRLQALAAPLDIPPLEQMPKDHVLTRSFYLLQDFPGRYSGRDVWVEAAPPDAARAEGMPFRDLNDGVTPVVIGGNDWAAAWAVDDRGLPMFPVGRGTGGDRQRELAYRFGVNLVMYVLTGNYKSDQVHVPALLERLGN